MRKISYKLPAVDLSVFQPEPVSDDEADQPNQSKDAAKNSADDEANEILQRILDEIQYEPPGGAAEEEAPEESYDLNEQFAPPLDSAHAPEHLSQSQTNIFDLPSTPSKDPDPTPSSSALRPPTTNTPKFTTDTDLASRFRTLTTTHLNLLKPSTASTFELPSAPSSDPANLPSTPTSKPGISTKAPTSTPPDEDIETWCCICNDDAILRCVGCDGDLYCTNCWNEGHRGDDAGYEERTHKAVLYNKDKKQKEGKRRVSVGAV